MKKRRRRRKKKTKKKRVMTMKIRTVRKMVTRMTERGRYRLINLAPCQSGCRVPLNEWTSVLPGAQPKRRPNQKPVRSSKKLSTTSLSRDKELHSAHVFCFSVPLFATLSPA